MRLQVRWRQWLARTLIGRWLADRHFYQLTIVHTEADNPEARIAEDGRTCDRAAGRFFAGRSERLAGRDLLHRHPLGRRRLPDRGGLFHPRLHGVRLHHLFRDHDAQHVPAGPAAGAPRRGKGSRRSAAALRTDPREGQCRKHRDDRRRRRRTRAPGRNLLRSRPTLARRDRVAGSNDVAEWRKPGSGPRCSASARGAEISLRRDDARFADAGCHCVRAGPGRAQLARRQCDASGRLVRLLASRDAIV